MAPLACLLRDLGHSVQGIDKLLYSPTKELLDDAGLPVLLDDASQLSQQTKAALRQCDLCVVGNAYSRGHPLVEALLNSQKPMLSAPEVLRQYVLKQRPTVVVAGTHGKTTTTAMIAHVLQERLDSVGWLIPGAPLSPHRPWNLGKADAPFVIEGDEYDCSFFDKRAKFLHYRPKYLAVTGLEFDHADIYSDLAEIQVQFHRLIRALPSKGHLVVAGGPCPTEAMEAVLNQELWTPTTLIHLEEAGANSNPRTLPNWAKKLQGKGQLTQLSAKHTPRRGAAGAQPKQDLTIAEKPPVLAADSAAPAPAQQQVEISQLGSHNAANAVTAYAICRAMGVPAAEIGQSLGTFKGVDRRLHVAATMPSGALIYEDFAHHPTAIAATLEALRAAHGYGADSTGRLIAVIDLSSTTMRSNHHLDRYPAAVEKADECYWWSIDASAAQGVAKATAGHFLQDIPTFVDQLKLMLQPQDCMVLMSSAHFGNLLGQIRQKYPS